MQTYNIYHKHRAWAEVDLGIIAQNIREIRKYTNKSARIMAVVKADAYGHGYLEVSKTLLENGADTLGVALLDEAIQLRKHGIDSPIIILGATNPVLSEDLVKYSIIPTVFNEELPRELSKAATKLGKKAKVHIKIDTGMNRVGFLSNDPDSVRKVIEIAKLPNIEIEGIFTHFACADDEKEDPFTLMQFERFMDFIRKLEKEGVYIPVKHCCNSAALLRFPNMHLDMVRPGIILYGHYPSKDTNKNQIKLQSAMSLKAIITHIKDIEKDERISYGGIYRCDSKKTIATIPIGYADGYSRILSGKVSVLVGDKKVKNVGRICMDQCMLDVTNVQNINVGDEVVLFGTKNGNSIDVEELAEIMGTINYEVLCVIGKRIPRVYIQDGLIVDVLNYLV
ncbi:MAG: alanine racemase [Clostridiaceae bacterium]|nr:alanine racemase [Clostridiaceae bacterium]